jgi:GNAT superfamily N-acetyltransferase
MATIRPFDSSDAEAAAELLFRLVPASVQTADSLRHRQEREPARARRASWVAVENEALVGFATAQFRWYGGESDDGRIWVGVDAPQRQRGIGAELWEACSSHLEGATRVTVEVDGDPAGLRFVGKRGFTEYGSEVMSRLIPEECVLEPKPHEGYHVLPLGAVRDREQDLFEFYAASGGVRPGDPENQVTFEEWRDVILGNPMLDDDGSVVVVDSNDRIVSMSWLLVDRARRRAMSEWTATLPRLRSHGLARLAKLAAIRWAAAHNLVELVTGNEPDNLHMLELNRALGYRKVCIRRDLERRHDG